MSASPEPSVRDVDFEPVADEATAHDLPVAGTLPPQLNGVYLRDGPNPRPGSARRFLAGDDMVPASASKPAGQTRALQAVGSMTWFGEAPL
jgi:carotenoid cleavage dioxygenase-like enzyme